MSGLRKRGENVRCFLLENVEKEPAGLTQKAAEKFGITRQAVNKHLQRLAEEGALKPDGNTRNRTYKLAAVLEWKGSYQIADQLDEHTIWERDIKPVLGKLPDNVLDIWQYCVTEMFNNAIDHSNGTTIVVKIAKTAINSQIVIYDDGVGIFRKIQKVLNLIDERHALLELTKGKLTTDPKRHTGQGIFFTSRVTDRFDVRSGVVYFGHLFGDDEDWIYEMPTNVDGTAVFLKLGNHSARTLKRIFDQYSDDQDYGFIKTVVPVRLAQYGNDKLVSRSQAKQVTSRVELFKTVIFDFTDVPTIGQAFADQIFRVFAQEHPQLELVAVHTNSDVKRMIEAAKAGIKEEKAIEEAQAKLPLVDWSEPDNDDGA